MKRPPAPARPLPEDERQLAQARERHVAGDLAAAEAVYRELLARRPDHGEALFLLGTLHVQRGAPLEAVALLERAAARQPRHDAALYNLGIARQNTGAHDLAIRCFEQLAARAPSADAWNNLGVSLQALGRLDEARAAFRKALALDAAHPLAHANLACVLNALDEPQEAERHARAALARKPDHAPAHNHLASALRAQGRHEEARASLEQALRFRPDYAEAWFNLGILHQDKNELDDALRCYDRAIALAPHDAIAHLNRANVLLLSGDFARGWVEYDWRFIAHRTPRRPLPWPLWDGSPLAGKRLLVCAEQGVGDEIMFASCFPELLRSAARCVIECDRRLAPLFRRSFPGAEIVGGKVEKGIREDTTARLTALGPFDFQAAMGDPPRYLRPDPARFPRVQGYLQPDPGLLAKWRARYDALGPGRKIGISWRGGRTGAQQRLRSIALTDWRNILAIPGVHFVNLQYGDTQTERQRVKELLCVNVHHWEDSDPLADLDDFAAQIAALDLVISIDNATVHLAGALGVATWVLLPLAPDWRWLLGRDDTPWYPNLRLFRQPAPGAWDAVLSRVAQALRAT
jgi:tetratricopeptide (TPR) repeat protein